MSDYSPAFIHVGGKLSRALLPGLCEAVDGDAVSTEYGANDLQSIEEIIEYVEKMSGDKVGLIFYDEEAKNGDFPCLQVWLVDNQVPFIKQVASSASWDEQAEVYLPEWGEVRSFATADTNTYITLSDLGEIVRQAADAKDDLSQVLTQYIRDNQLPDLPVFELVD